MFIVDATDRWQQRPGGSGPPLNLTAPVFAGPVLVADEGAVGPLG